MAMGIAPSTSQTTVQAATAPPPVAPVLTMQQVVDQQQLQQIQIQQQQQQIQQYIEYANQHALNMDPYQQILLQQQQQAILAGEEGVLGRDAMDSVPSGQSLASITTLEQLQKELENITHVHVAPKKDSASATQNTSICENPPTDQMNEELQTGDDGLPVTAQYASQAELLQQQIQSHDNTSSISEITNINSSGALSRDDTSVYNSRRTSTDMNIVDIPQVQQAFMEVINQAVEGSQPPSTNTKVSHQNSLEKSDR